MIIKIDTQNPDRNRVLKASSVLERGGLVVFPTDTVYAVGCKAGDKTALQKLCSFKNTDLKRANFSILFKDFTQISNYVMPLSSIQFRFMKKVLPGPYSIILPSNKNAEKLFNYPKKTIGVRIPDLPLIIALINELNAPIVTTSLHDDNVEWEFYLRDPEEIHDLLSEKVDLVVDGGIGEQVPSSIVDATSDELHLVRAGKGTYLLD